MIDGSQVVSRAVGFGRALRDAGIGVGLSGTTNFCEALTVIDIGDREAVRSAGVAVFVRRHEEIPTYYDVFDSWWRAPAEQGVEQSPPRLGADPNAETLEKGVASSGADASHGSDQDGDAIVSAPDAYSAWERLRQREFERMTEAELRDAERLIDLLAPRIERRRSRRYRLHSHGPVLAPRQMFRRNVSSGGDLVEWMWRRRVDEPRPLVVLCDISGSMERHSRLLLRFVQALSAATSTHAEAFVFGTRLSRVTRQLRSRDRDAGMAQVAASVADWGGGTRIGSSFREFNVRWARRVLRSSGVVIVVSDGWDLGDPELVRTETARLRRNCHRLIWLNPLASSPGFRPLAAGMAAAFPYVDDFLPAGSIASLERLGVILAGLSR